MKKRKENWHLIAPTLMLAMAFVLVFLSLSPNQKEFSPNRDLDFSGGGSSPSHPNIYVPGGPVTPILECGETRTGTVTGTASIDVCVNVPGGGSDSNCRGLEAGRLLQVRNQAIANCEANAPAFLCRHDDKDCPGNDQGEGQCSPWVERGFVCATTNSFSTSFHSEGICPGGQPIPSGWTSVESCHIYAWAEARGQTTYGCDDCASQS